MRFACLLLLGLAPFAFGEAQRWYQIDVLVFSQQAEDAKIPESFPVNIDLGTQTFVVEPVLAELPEPPEQKTPALPLRLPFAGEALVERIGERYQPKARLLVPEVDRQLAFATDQFDRQSRYDTLGYWSWYEPMVVGEQNEFPVALTATSADGDWQLDGEISLRLSRFIHIDSHIEWQREVEVVTEPEVADTPEARMQAMMEAPSTQVGWQTLTIEQSARMRSNELHYLDHPEMGVLLRARPIEVAEGDS